ncbi:BRISC complex subunit Abraxas 2-like [Patiria miniata]|uniref:Uncharacterized protein n=1 Tax=Patiria miniata TaxID=46514 RepID=A0A914B5I7_PATMI|nr:BRISC complex subunit Abraxas 2-like [Patiria miniata]
MAASRNLNVNVSGCVWSSLFLDHASSMGDQEGFLFGEIRRHTNEDISDSQITRKIEQISINIYSHYACDEPFSFYDRRGRVDQVKLLSMLKDNYKHIIGWYRFRRNTMLDPSMRETTLHRELLNLFHTDTPDLFLLGLFTSGMAWNQATHFFNHQLLTLGNRGLTRLGANIINLGDTGHSEYRASGSAGTVATVQGTYSRILTDFRGRTADSLHGVRVIRDINDSVYSKMQILKNKLGTSEQLLQTEIEEVRELQREKKERREAQKRLEQQARTATARPESPAASMDVDTLVLAKAVVHHPKPPPTRQKEPLKPSLAPTFSNPPKPAQARPAQAASVPPSRPAGRSSATSSSGASSIAKDATPKLAVVSPEGSSKDPFAGLFKDMKKSIQKTTSLGEELRPAEQDGPRSARAHSWDKAKEAELRSSPAKSRERNSMDLSDRPPPYGSSPLQGSPASWDGSSPQRWNTEDSDDATQMPEYPSSASPTF